MSELHELSAVDLAARVRRGEITAESVATHFLGRAKRLNPELNVFLAINDHAVEDARAIDRKIAQGEDPGPLAGVPIAVKDNISVKGMPLTCASKILAGYRPAFEAHAVERLRAAGAIFIGKTNLDEFAMGSSTENSAFGPSRNPWDKSRAPGGSSGGSAVAVAAGLALGSLGSETGGSVRQPASFCSIAGLKPTYGRISRYGLVAFGSSLDQIGVFARGAADTALITEVMAGFDGRDSTSSHHRPQNYAETLGAGVKGLRIGVPKEYMGEGIEPGVRGVVESAIAELKGLGAEIVTVDLPHTKYAIPVYYIVCTSEASSNLARFDGVRYGPRQAGESVLDMYRSTRNAGFGDEVKRRIMLGTFCLSSGYYDAFYDKALRVRTLLKKDFDLAFEKVDVLVGPTAPTLPFRIGEKANDPLAMYLSDILTAALNLVGIPGLSIPAGFVADGGKKLPVGLQIIAPEFREDLIFRTAAAFEKQTTHHRERASV
jgi:aspartyl-tRNA(Asn)/glutamyl-tRNA(Gln) amidotransferase subunit A